MYNNDYMYAIERNDEYLAHYGVRGMKWGVRKAIASGNSKRLSRQYAKAQKKLAKLQKRATSGKKYAKRAALLGAGAAAAGGLAAAGTSGVGKLMGVTGRAGNKIVKGAGSAVGAVGRGMENVGLLARGSHNKHIRRIGSAVSGAGLGVQNAGRVVRSSGNKVSGAMTGARYAVENWGKSTSISGKIRKGLLNDSVQNLGRTYHGAGGQIVRGVGSKVSTAADKTARKLAGVSNNTIARIGAGAIGAGLGVAAGYNAYRAATTKRAAKKAAQFQSEMNKAFAGTKYANGGNRQGKKRKRR